MRRLRAAGKSDTIDAEAAARSVLAGQSAAIPRWTRVSGPRGFTGRGGAYNRPLTRPIATARYPLAFRRFAQDAFIRFDMAFLAAALIGFRFCVAVG